MVKVKRILKKFEIGLNLIISRSTFKKTTHCSCLDYTAAKEQIAFVIGKRNKLRVNVEKSRVTVVERIGISCKDKVE